MKTNEGVVGGGEFAREMEWPSWFSKVATGAALVPIVGYLVLMGFAGLASLQVGHWPVYSQPDPKDVGPLWFGVGVELFILLLVLLTPGALLTMGLMMVLEQIKSRRSWAQRSGVVLARAVAFASGAVLFFLALVQHQNWLMD